jgi:hypothetical protein
MDKNIRVIIPSELNIKLNEHIERIRDVGVKITKAELIIRLASLGLQVEKKEIKIDSIKP